MTWVLVLALWVGALVFFLLLAGGVRRADALREGSVRRRGPAPPSKETPVIPAAQAGTSRRAAG